MDINQGIEIYYDRFLNSDKFSNMVKQCYVSNRGMISYVESIFEVCKRLGIDCNDVDKIKKLINCELKEKIENECIHKNMIKKSSLRKTSPLF